MKNKKFSVLANLGHSLRGLKEVFKNETAFRVEVYCFIVLAPIAILLPISLIAKAVLILSMFIVFLAELINSAVERAVDTATLEYDENAKKAKDAGSTVVLFAIILVSSIWIFTIYYTFFNR